MPDAAAQAAHEAIARVVARSIRAQDPGDVANDAFAKFLPHAWRLPIGEVPAYATRVAKSACADYFAQRKNLPKTNEPFVDRVVVTPDSEDERGGGLEPEMPVGAQLLAWFNDNGAAAGLQLGPQERRYLKGLRSGQSDGELATQLGVHRSRVWQLRVTIGAKARLLAMRSRTRRLREVE